MLGTCTQTAPVHNPNSNLYITLFSRLYWELGPCLKACLAVHKLSDKFTVVTSYQQQLCLQKKSLSWSQKAASLWSSLFQGYER